MILTAYDLYSNGVDIIFSVVFGLFGLFLLFAPYDTIKKFCPKALSQKKVRICGALLVVLTIIGAIVDFAL